MSKPIRAKPVIDSIGQLHGYSIVCPGCNQNHVIYTNPVLYNICWGFNGDCEKPTFSPSLLCLTGSFAKPDYIDDPDIPPTRCHSFITDGRIQYLNDCTHNLKGQTLELPNII